MRLPTVKQIELFLKILIVIAAIVLVALLMSLFQEYKHLSRLNYISARQSWLSALRAHSPAGINEVSSIQAWMTFDYVNHLFVIPADYLKTNLSIVDSRYPRLTISQYAKDNNANRLTILTSVQNAVRAYFSPKK